MDVSDELQEEPFSTEFEQFIKEFAELYDRQPQRIKSTLRNIFSMRIFGNKTHGDLAEVAFTQLINSFLSNYEASHVGKEKFRAKSAEEDVLVSNKDSGESFPVSLKAYGPEYLQLSTNKDSSMFSLLQDVVGETETSSADTIDRIVTSDAFTKFEEVNVIPLIYDESSMEYNVMIFDITRAYESVETIRHIGPEDKKRRKHPVYRFYGDDDQYILEVRYGGTGANALQRGMWTHIKRAEPFFNSITNGWQPYSINETLLELFSDTLVESEETHQQLIDQLPG